MLICKGVCPKMIIRKARMRDYKVFDQLQIDSYGFTLWSKYKIIRYMIKGFSFYLLYDDRDENVVGFITVIYRRNDVYLANIGISEQHKSKGYGQKVFDWWISEGILRNKKTVTLHTSVQNQAMLTLAERNGFKTINTIKGYYSSGYLDGDAVLLQKSLPVGHTSDYSCMS